MHEEQINDETRFAVIFNSSGDVLRLHVIKNLYGGGHQIVDMDQEEFLRFVEFGARCIANGFNQRIKNA